jgi:succinate dehydrogenase / fumarate reductase, flavoprotein subunit
VGLHKRQREKKMAMNQVNGLKKVIETDVLVIGGGISGLLAAIKARESADRVLVVDKGGIGWAGQVPFSGGDCAIFRPEEADRHFQWLLKVGEGLNDRQWASAFAHDMWGCINEAAGMDLPFWTEDKKLVAAPFSTHYDAVRFNPAKLMIKLKHAASRSGVKTMDKIFMTDLLTADGTISGAVGFGLVDGNIYVLKSGAVVIANGSCRYQAQRNFSVNAGEGVAMAFRAGATLMNAEFANTYTFGFKGDIRRRLPLYRYFENVLGELFVGRYCPELRAGQATGQESLDFYRIADAMVSEVEAGRGPIYIDFRKLSNEEKRLVLEQEAYPAEFQPVGRSDLLNTIREKLRVDPDRERIAVELQFAGGQGPIRIDLECRTTVKGLWAVGDAGSLGSAYMGARASGTFGGFGVAFAIASGLKGGSSAGRYASQADAPAVDEKELKNLEKRMMAPLGRTGSLSVNEIIRQVHEAVIPVKYNLHRKKERLEEALSRIETGKAYLAKAGVRDAHSLARFHQAESMTMSAGWTLQAAMLREESRGTHHRVDFPARNDQAWERWISIRADGPQSVFSTESVPSDTSTTPNI